MESLESTTSEPQKSRLQQPADLNGRTLSRLRLSTSLPTQKLPPLHLNRPEPSSWRALRVS